MATTHRPIERAPTHPPDLITFTVAHRALRRGGSRLPLALRGLGVADTARARAIRRWYGGFHAELDGHHTVEDRVWFPALAGRVPTFAEHTDRLAREHQMLDDAQRGVALALDRLVETEAAAGARAAAHERACALSSLLEGHLEFEDADILPLYLRHFTKEEYDEIEARARRLVAVRRLSFAVPWMLDAATPGERRRLLGHAPMAAKVLWYAGRRRHARLSARALGPTTEGVA